MNPTFDAHIHIWQRQWQDAIVGTGRSGARDQFHLVLALMDRHGVERACVLGACDEANPDNNAFVADVCREHADRFVMLSEIPLLSDRRDELLERTIHDWPARGFRGHVTLDEQPRTWTGPAWDAFWHKVDDAGLVVTFNIAPAQAAQLPPMIRKYPNVTWMLDHMGRPWHDMTDEAYQPVLDLAAFPNVRVKVSAFYAFTEHPAEYPYADLSRFVVKLRDAFSPRRLMWASDIPPALEFGSYEHTFRCFDHIPQLRDDDREWLFGRSAKELFG